MHDEFVQALETAHAGQPFFSAEVARLALNQLVCGNGPGPDPDDLKSREEEALTCVAQGHAVTSGELSSHSNCENQELRP